MARDRLEVRGSGCGNAKIGKSRDFSEIAQRAEADYPPTGVTRKTHTAIGPYGRSIPMSMGPSYGRCVSLNSSHPCMGYSREPFGVRCEDSLTAGVPPNPGPTRRESRRQDCAYTPSTVRTRSWTKHFRPVTPNTVELMDQSGLVQDLVLTRTALQPH